MISYEQQYLHKEKGDNEGELIHSQRMKSENKICLKIVGEAEAIGAITSRKHLITPKLSLLNKRVRAVQQA